MRTRDFFVSPRFPIRSRDREMERVSEVLQFPVVVEWDRSFPLDPQPLQKFDFLLGGSSAEGTVIQEFFEPRLFLRLVGRPGASLRFKTISMPKVARSMSQDSISGSKKETQFSIDTLKTFVSRNSRIMTRISS